MNKLNPFNIHCLLKWGKFLKNHHFYFMPKIIRFWIKLVCNCDIPLSNSYDNSIHYNHNGFGIVITPSAIIGKNVDIQHSVTIGIKYGLVKAPIIEDNVVIGARAIIIGPVKIGHNSIIGAGAVVIKDVPPYSVVVGNPGKIVKEITN